MRTHILTSFYAAFACILCLSASSCDTSKPAQSVGKGTANNNPSPTPKPAATVQPLERYFVGNNVPLPNELNCFAFGSQAAFETVMHPAATNTSVPMVDFTKNIVIGVVMQPQSHEVQFAPLSQTSSGHTLVFDCTLKASKETLSYSRSNYFMYTIARRPAPDDIRTVEFRRDGKKVATVKVSE